MARILITGGAGYVGSHCAKALAAMGHEGVVFDTTSGRRNDIAKAYPQAITDNVAISGASIQVACHSGQKVISLAITTRHQVAIIGRSDIEGCP